MTHRIATAEQAKLLLDEQLRPTFVLLLEQPRSATELAEALGVDLNRAYYLLRKLERADIVQVISHTPRTGRPLKRYAVPPRWFVPFDVTGAETLEAFVHAQTQPIMQSMTKLALTRFQAYLGERPGFWLEGESLWIGDEDNMLVIPAAQAAEPILFQFGGLNLSDEHALELGRRFQALFKEFEALHDETQPGYRTGVILLRGEV